MSLPSISDEIILEKYPLPIAHEYKELLDIPSTEWISLSTQLSQVIDISIRYCTAIALSQYYADWNKTQRNPNETDFFIASNLHNPTTSVCLDIMRKISKIYLRPHQTFIPELISFCITRDGEAADGMLLAMELNVFASQLDSADFNEYRHKSLYQENIEKTRKLLQHLHFLQNYALLRIVSISQDTNISVVNFLMGNTIDIAETEYFSSSPESILGDLEPNNLCLYSNQSNQWLSLLNYTLFSHCQKCEDEKRRVTNRFFIFERTYAQKDIYVGLEDTLGQPHRISLDSLVKELWESKLLIQGEALKNWIQIQQMMRTRAQDLLNNLRDKHDPSLYLPRENIQAEIKKFLASDKTGFLVVGDSGVGKTNLLCEIAASEIEAESIVSIENCATFNATDLEHGLDQFLCKRYGFDLKLGFIGTLTSFSSDILENQKFILILDAINEYKDPNSLLENIYTWLVVPTNHLPWFKLILSCRSESWARMAGGFQGERHFLTGPDGVHHSLKRFTDDEIPKAYELYRKQYKVNTPYEELSPQAKNFISLPLMLRFVTESQSEKEIPKILKIHEVFARYIDEKMDISDKVISRNEHLILDRLVSRMYAERSDHLDLGELFDDPVIGQLVMNQKPGHPWLNLLDKGMLMTVPGQAGKQFVRFTFDQIFEFLLAQMIWPQNPNIDNITARIDEVFQDGNPYPSLWGAIKLKLISRLDQIENFLNDDLLLHLAQEENPNVRAIVIDVLVVMASEGKSRFQQVESFILELVKSDEEVPGSLGVEIAHRIKSHTVLEAGMLSYKRRIWQMATLYVFFLWQRDFEAGSQSFHNIQDVVSKQISLKGVPKAIVNNFGKKDAITGAQAYLYLALLSISLAHHYPEAARVVGKSTLEWLNRIPNLLKRSIDKLLEVTKVGKNVIFGILGTGPIVQIRSFRPFFMRPLDDKRRKQCFEVINHLDHNKGDLAGELGDLIFDLSHEMDAWCFFCISTTLLTRISDKFDSFFNFCQRLFNEGNLHSKYIVLRLLPLVTYMELNGPYCTQAHINFSNKVIKYFISPLPKQIEYAWQDTPSSQITKQKSPIQIDFGFSTELITRSSGTLELVQEILSLPWDLPEEQRSLALMDQIYRAVLICVATNKLNILPALETISNWFHKEVSPSEKEELVRVLSGIRSFYPEQVDRYLSEAPNWLKVQVSKDFYLAPLNWILNQGSQIGQPWLIRNVPELRQAFSDAIGRISLNVTNEIELEREAHQLGVNIINTEMITKFATALQNAGNSDTSSRE